jgi:hypothetical protein
VNFSYRHTRVKELSYLEWTDLTDEITILHLLEFTPANGVTGSHFVTPIHIAHMMVTIHHNLQLYGFPSLIVAVDVLLGHCEYSSACICL